MELPDFNPLRFPEPPKKPTNRPDRYRCGYCKKLVGHNSRTCPQRRYDVLVEQEKRIMREKKS